MQVTPGGLWHRGCRPRSGPHSGEVGFVGSSRNHTGEASDPTDLGLRDSVLLIILGSDSRVSVPTAGRGRSHLWLHILLGRPTGDMGHREHLLTLQAVPSPAVGWPRCQGPREYRKTRHRPCAKELTMQRGLAEGLTDTEPPAQGIDASLGAAEPSAECWVVVWGAHCSYQPWAAVVDDKCQGQSP